MVQIRVFWDPHSLIARGAGGLTQFLPSTWFEMASTQGTRLNSVAREEEQRRWHPPLKRTSLAGSDGLWRWQGWGLGNRERCMRIDFPFSHFFLIYSWARPCATAVIRVYQTRNRNRFSGLNNFLDRLS